MFFADRTINEYREISLASVVKEYLLFKGTRTKNGEAINKKVRPKDLCGSALFVYKLKSNTTNKAAVVYYCEREARRRDSMDGEFIIIPEKFWEVCDKINYEMTKGRDRKEDDNG